ncbi:MAG: hypothetical protein UX39_C0010G0002 [Candidatus Magasanikbacteria bacterium GW2011_GWA2_46_17]|uniref:Glycoside hydrolase family 42 N-terminal domain-containing protein n=1 Tax=Candidatus Magasanikbacteria bacterium GW2011_GWA2_46_17 TaxID=1619042 RepID=A0A0G1RZA7_9BACT|nr:MAG: hypothetical protein UX39_C0010G0002 [Candidatus Magasanikbacteria bacterium GW2011_GWA2_46_17]
MLKKFLKYGAIVFLIVVVIGVIRGGADKKGQNNRPTEPPTENPRQSETANKTPAPKQGSNKQAPRSKEIIIGIEYAVRGQVAAEFAKLGIPAVKPLPESINWSKMQPDISKSVNYTDADQFVRDYQKAGFREIVMGLRTLSHAEDNQATYGKNRPVPKPEYRDEYAAWIKGMVERYDKDGRDDMPGLKYPVRYYEIEVEFSAYTPERTGEYLEKLKIAYEAAHQAYADVLVAHSAFLTATAFDSDPQPSQYEKAFAEMYIPDKHHNLADMRKILDRPELFDLVNFHELADPIMIERTVKWLKYETARRGYTKPIIISDTSPSPFISYGRATGCTGLFLGIVVWPAKEKDRCRLADYFNGILNNNAATVEWKNRFVAGDMVKKVVIAAANGVQLINTAFTGDLPILSTKFGFAGAGNGGFAGVVSEQYNLITQKYRITEYRPGFYALKQLAGKLKGTLSIVRERSDNDVRLYRIKNAREEYWIGWVHPDYLILPDDQEPKKQISLNIPNGARIINMAKSGEAENETVVSASNGSVKIDLTTTPVYIFKASQ